VATVHRYSPAPPTLAAPHMLEPAGSLRHVAGFPDLGLLRTRRPTPPSSADDASTRRVLPGRQTPDGNSGMVPTFTTNRSSREAPSYAPATSPRLRRRPSPWPPDQRHLTGQGVPARHDGQVRAAIQPRSTGFELAALLRGFTPLVPHVRLLVSLAEPAPSGSTDTSRRCRSCLPPSPASPGSGCSQLHRPAATGRRWRSFTPTRFGEVGSGRPADVTAGGFPRAASRTRRARHRATGSPQAPWGLDAPYAPAGHGAGMRVPR
jgi:hypothetical protein